MTDNILISSNNLILRKPLWSEEEILVARCMWFDVNIEANTITINMNVTFRKAVFAFLEHAFVAFSTQPQYAVERMELHNAINAYYRMMFEQRKQSMSKTLPWYNQLWAHQKNTIAAASSRKVNFFSLQPRLGKTVCTASVSIHNNVSRTVVVTFDIGKWNWMYDMTDEKWGARHIIDETNFTILDRTKKRSMDAFEERFVIINYDSLHNFIRRIVDGGPPIGHIILSECFTYDTEVLTEKGWLKIGDIVTQMLSLKVLSFDKETCRYSFKEVIDWSEKERNSDLVKITLCNGRSITCTEDHKIWVVGHGYKKAKALTLQDVLQTVQKRNVETEEREPNTKVLQSSLPGDIHNESEWSQGKAELKKSCSQDSREGLRMVSEEVYSTSSLRKETAKKILWEEMFCALANVFAGRDRLHENSRVPEKSISKLFKKLRIKSVIKGYSSSKDEGSQPNVYARSEGKDDRVIKESNISVFGESTNPNKMAEDSSRSDWPSNGIQASSNRSKASIQEPSGSILAGPCMSTDKTVRGNRRTEPQKQEAEVYRQKEDVSFECSRVARIEILEQGGGNRTGESSQYDKVYDLTVKDNHNYFANGVLVSNCQKIKNFNSAKWKNVYKLVSLCPDARITFESGTPIMNRADDLFSYFRLVGHPLGEKYSDFKRMFLQVTGMGKREKISGTKNIKLLQLCMSNFMIRYTQEECTDIPKHSYVNMYFNLDEWKPHYQEALEHARKSENRKVLESYIHSINRVMAMAKIPGVIEHTESLIDAEEKVVILTLYQDSARKIADHFGDKCVLIDGSVDGTEKVERSRRFKSDPNIMVAVVNMMAAGHTISLASSSHGIVLSLPLSPKVLEQATDRLKDITKTKPSTIYYALCRDDEGGVTVDERLMALNSSKDSDIAAVIDNKDSASMQENAIDVLWRDIVEQKDEV